MVSLAASHFHLTLAEAVAIAAAAIALVSAFLAGRSVREARKANALSVLSDFFERYRHIDPDRRYVLTDLPRGDPRGRGVSGLPETSHRHAATVIHYLDQLGFLVGKKLVGAKDVASLMGASIERCWKVLKPYVENERKARAPDYAQHFEKLNEKIAPHRRRIEKSFAEAAIAEGNQEGTSQTHIGG